MFAAGRPMSMNELLRLFSEDERPERKVMKEIIAELEKEYEGRGIELIEVASGYRIQVKHHMGEWLGRLTERRPPRYSRALMETLALIAYRQPITRGDIEDVRGVSVSTNIIRTLLERGWVRIVGHRDVPGRPAMFGTSKEFLDYFNLKSLDELPSLAELKDIESMNEELDFGSPPYDDGEEVDDLQTADGGDTRAEFEEEFGEDLTLEATSDAAGIGDEASYDEDADVDDVDDDDESDADVDDEDVAEDHDDVAEDGSDDDDDVEEDAERDEVNESEAGVGESDDDFEDDSLDELDELDDADADDDADSIDERETLSA